MKLKTLKDIENTDFSTQESNKGMVRAVVYDIRQEAIKWIKELKEQKEIIIPITDFKGDFLVKENNQESGIIYYIKHFFNLTEEDLK